MDAFEDFKLAREKMDPSSRKLSEQQWNQAYAAYLKSRERVSGIDNGTRKSRNVRNKISKRGTHAPSNLSELGLLRRTVRDQSAYADLRLIVNYLAWLAIVLVILATIVSLFYYTSSSASIVVLLKAALQVIGIVILRLLSQVLIDIPDIALFRALRTTKSK
jgi:multidrug efflux pump subunit AcrB